MFLKDFKRDFELWAYLVGHGQLLLRSAKTEEHATRVDIAFKGVSYVQVPTLIERLSISVGTPADLPEDVRRAVDMSHKSVYMLQGEAARGLVIAGSAQWHEDDGEYSGQSAIFPLGYGAPLPSYTK